MASNPPSPASKKKRPNLTLDLSTVNAAALPRGSLEVEEILVVATKQPDESVTPGKKRPIITIDASNLPEGESCDIEIITSSPGSSRSTSQQPVVQEHPSKQVKRDGMNIQELLNHVKLNGRKGLCKEFSNISSSDLFDDFSASDAAENAQKNRYADILCLESTRVILQSNADESDYINANYIRGYSHDKAYIATQGPLENTIHDFWRLVWQESVGVIVMMTKLTEFGRSKCELYWPDEPSDTREEGRLRIVNCGIVSNDDYQITSLEVTNLETNEMRHVEHFLFLSWVDLGVPISVDIFMEFLYNVRESQQKLTAMMKWMGRSGGPPILVHCSAGIGRTGTFIAIDISMYMLENTGRCDLVTVVNELRQQRARSVQTQEQYLFCHQVLLEYAAKTENLDLDVDLKQLL